MPYGTNSNWGHIQARTQHRELCAQLLLSNGAWDFQCPTEFKNRGCESEGLVSLLPLYEKT